MHDALEAYFKGDFNRCVSAIHSQLSGIVADRQSNENAYDLLSLYIHTLRFADLSPSMRRESIELLNSLSREDPDNATWRIACIRITYSDILDYRRIYEQSKTRLLDWNERLYRCNHALSECQNLEKVQRKKIQLAEDDYRPRLRSELSDILAIQCAVFTSKWLLEGGEGKSSLPDDAGDRGVDSRELAVRIAMDKDADCGKFKALTPEFLEIRNFIATTVKSQANGLFNSYYWNGEKHSSITPLQREIVNTAAKLRKHPSVRAYYDEAGKDPSDDSLDCTRLVGRSAWNTRWLLIIPAGSLGSDRETALSSFINGQDTDRDGTPDTPGISDILLGLKTYSHSGN